MQVQLSCLKVNVDYLQLHFTLIWYHSLMTKSQHSFLNKYCKNPVTRVARVPTFTGVTTKIKIFHFKISC